MRTVVFLCEHQPEGSFGFVLNKEYEQTLDELLTNMEGYPLPVYYGGPVQADTVHFIHQYPDLIPGSYKVTENIYWGGNFESLCALIRNNSIEPGKVKFFIGYSGWGDGQLGTELKEKSWLTAMATKKLVFNTAPDAIWKGSLLHLGGEYEMLVNYPIDPQLN